MKKSLAFSKNPFLPPLVAAVVVDSRMMGTNPSENDIIKSHLYTLSSPEVWVEPVVSVSNKYGTKPWEEELGVVRVDKRCGVIPAVLGEVGVEELGVDGAGVEELDGSIVGEDGAAVEEIGGSSVGDEGAGVEDDREVSVTDGGGVPQMQVHDCSG